MLDLIAIRRQLHQIPEIGLEEYQTQAFLLSVIEQLCQDKPFIQIKTWKTGILVFLKGYAPEKTVAWRSDMDGLPITEETGLAFASKNQGRMHACGHDIHMTMALGLLEALVEKQSKHNMLFIFQPAEENEAGGMLMYQSGALDEWMPDEVYALHVRPDLPVGTLASNRATLFAGTCEVKVSFKGKGGHAAFPHHANDALVAASYFVTQVQTIVSRNVDPIEGAVVTFGSLHAGTTNNVISQEALLHGTIRTLTHDMSRLTQRRLTEMAEGIAKSFGLEVDVHLKQGGYLPVENNPELADELITFFSESDRIDMIECLPAMTGEDFGFLLSKVKGVMFWLGVDTPYPLHHAKMSPDEGAIKQALPDIKAFLGKKVNS